MKPFKTISEQIDILESRGVEIDVDARPILLRENYYSVVNGYKGPFLDRVRMQSTNEDVYLEGTRFSDIYRMYLFDRRLRCVTLQYLLMAESALKTATVYAFCSNHRGVEDYLDRNSFARERDFLVPRTYKGNQRMDYKKNLDGLIDMLKSRVEIPRRPFVKHYMKMQGNVPLWVLANDLTFGNLSHFYQLMRRGDQNLACRCLDETATHGTDARLSPLKMLRAYQVLVKYRNICAHDERLYCAREEGVRYSGLESFLGRALDDATVCQYREKVGSLCEEFDSLSRWMPQGNFGSVVGVL
jgi:abortive infection bacteriophage resistance protein